MSQETVTKVILKAMSEEEFREQLFTDPGAALTGYDLTEEERQALNSLERESFDVMASDIEQRISKSFIVLPLEPPHRPHFDEPPAVTPINLPGPIT
jgi:hypothetical protein